VCVCVRASSCFYAFRGAHACILVRVIVRSSESVNAADIGIYDFTLNHLTYFRMFEVSYDISQICWCTYE